MTRYQSSTLDREADRCQLIRLSSTEVRPRINGSTDNGHANVSSPLNAVMPSTQAWWTFVDDLDRHFGDPVALDHVASIAAQVPVRVPLVADVDLAGGQRDRGVRPQERRFDDRHAVQERCLEHVDRRAKNRLDRPALR